jgi:hypothetical protein
LPQSCSSATLPNLLRISGTVPKAIVSVSEQISHPSEYLIAFMLSTVTPSLAMSSGDVVRPEQHCLLPDPSLILENAAAFGDQEFRSAFHVMQLCHVCLRKKIEAEEPEFDLLLVFLSLCGDSFPRSCLTRTIVVSDGTEFCNAFPLIVERALGFGCGAILEPFFLDNVSPSFSELLQWTPKIVGHFLGGHLMSF